MNDLDKKLSAASKDELDDYRSATRVMSFVTHFIGIGIMLIMLFYTTPLTVAPGLILIFLLSNLSKNLDDILHIINQKLNSKTDK